MSVDIDPTMHLGMWWKQVLQVKCNICLTVGLLMHLLKLNIDENRRFYVFYIASTSLSTTTIQGINLCIRQSAFRSHFIST